MGNGEEEREDILTCGNEGPCDENWTTLTRKTHEGSKTQETSRMEKKNKRSLSKSKMDTTSKKTQTSIYDGALRKSKGTTAVPKP